ncbi:MAG TPA: DUF6538 domain-containing protein [Falsiroseomonas sp.]|jgi:integrase|nr:DUF6538 domain-containing protein [Falsiroseomonas sp.]
MCRPTRHPKTGVYRIRKAVPADLRDAVGKWELIETLGTKDPAEAIRLAPDVMKRLEARIAKARASRLPGRPMSLREIMAHCGEWYREQVALHESDPGSAEGWDAVHDELVDQLQCEYGTIYQPDFQPSQKDLSEARAYLAERGVSSDADSLWRFAYEFFHTKRRAFALLARRAEGDYSQDQQAARYPALPSKAPDAEQLKGEELLEAWAAERQPSRATLKTYRGTFRNIARILGFDDVRRITVEHVVRFKEARLREGRDPGTVADDIFAAGAACGWAVKNRKLASNPFEGLAPKVSRRGPAPVAPYNDDDAVKTLQAARNEKGWLRWAPWLMCFSGARVSEIAALRRSHVRQEAGVWILDIRPTNERAGKNDIAQRMVPLHPAVIEEGFLYYVAALPSDSEGPLFPGIRPDPSGSRVVPATTKIGRWMRTKVGITDPRKAPSHSWRHRMQDELRRVRALPEVVDALTGRYNPRNAGDGYGIGFRGMPDELLKEVQKVPSPVRPLAAMPVLPFVQEVA